ncbi:MAG: phosphotransferase family protein [Betaproteobacteria bacterium]
MRSHPEGFDERDLMAALRDGWGLTEASAAYVPVGGGSYHWRADDAAGGRHWVTVDDLDNKEFLGGTRTAVLDRLRQAFGAARRLRARGLEFVVAPVPTRGGAVVYPVGRRFAVTVFPYLAAPAGQYGEPRPAAERAAVIDVLVRLHSVNLGSGTVAQVTPEVPHRAELEMALDAAGQPWSGGPYAERAGALFARRAAEVGQALTTFDQLVRDVRAKGAEPVLTHGEPHPGNIIVSDGQTLLVDWDTLALALPERDLWMLDRADERERYAEASGRPVDDAAIRLYRSRWELDDIASIVHALRSPHDDNADSARMWRAFAGSLELTGVWPYGRPA